jgi:hypothetical protein
MVFLADPLVRVRSASAPCRYSPCRSPPWPSCRVEAASLPSVAFSRGCCTDGCGSATWASSAPLPATTEVGHGQCCRRRCKGSGQLGRAGSSRGQATAPRSRWPCRSPPSTSVCRSRINSGLIPSFIYATPFQIPISACLRYGDPSEGAHCGSQPSLFLPLTLS